MHCDLGICTEMTLAAACCLAISILSFVCILYVGDYQFAVSYVGMGRPSDAASVTAVIVPEASVQTGL